TKSHAVDRGLYFVRLHWEFPNAVPSVANVLLHTAESQGGAGVVARYRALKRDSAQAYYFDQRSLTPAANWLLDKKKAQHAVMLFRLIVEANPNDWGSHRGLGESYLAVGDTANAIISYRRALELSRLDESTPRAPQRLADVLTRLGAKP